MNHLDLFSGIGGFSLAARWMGWETVVQVEWDKWCQKVLAKNFPDALRFGDIKEFNDMIEDGKIITNTEGAGLLREKELGDDKENNGTGRGCNPSDIYKIHRENGEIITDNDRRCSTQSKEQIQTRRDFIGNSSKQFTRLGRIDIITGGFPCQPFSHAGKRKGVADERYLWPEMLRTIRIFKPSFVVGENVAGLVSMDNGKTLDAILSDLEDEGYQVESFIIPACAVGAWHRRDRIWIVAHSLNSTDRTNRGQGRKTESIPFECGQTGLSRESCRTGSKIFPDSDNERQQTGRECNITSRTEWITRSSYEGATQWQFEPSVGRGFNGLPLWLHRHTIKGYGQNESYRRIEILRELWKTIPTQVLWQVIGGFNQIQKSEILFSIVCEYEARPNETRLLLESKETLEVYVRGLWMRGEITGSSYRPEKGEQLSGEHTDSLQTLSRLLAHNLQKNWQVSSWEDGIPRVSTGIKNRVDRLKGLGNAIVPQVVYQIFKAIEQLNRVI